MKRTFLALALLVCVAAPLRSQYLNADLDFEQTKGQYRVWWNVMQADTTSTIRLDSQRVFSGKSSLQLKNSGMASQSGLYVYLPYSLFAGKTCEISLQMRKEYDSTKVLLANISLLGSAQTLDSLKPVGKKDKRGWQKYTVSQMISTAKTSLILYFSHSQPGSVWLDNVEIRLNGKLYIPTVFRSPTPDQTTWIQQHFIPLQFTKPQADTFSDLAPLRSIIGEAELVGLGECNHGTQEFYHLRHRICEYAVSNLGFTTIALENSSFIGTNLLNRYVSGENVNPKEAIDSSGYFTTQEFIDFATWARTYNQTSNKKIRFIGIDLSDPIERFYRPLSYSLKTLDSSWFAGIQAGIVARKDSVPTLEEAKLILNHLNTHAEKFGSVVSARQLEYIKATVTQMMQAIAIAPMYQNPEANAGAYRDSCMAANLLWTKQYFQDGKILVWSHNAHLMTWAAKRNMGWHLRKALQDKYLPISFTFYEGEYRAWKRVEGKSKFIANSAGTPEPGTIEWAIKAAVPKASCGILDFRQGEKTPEWTRDVLFMRDAGVRYTPYQFAEFPLCEAVEVLVYVTKSTPTDSFWGR